MFPILPVVVNRRLRPYYHARLTQSRPYRAKGMRRVSWIVLALLLQRTASERAPNAVDSETGFQPWFETGADIVFIAYHGERLTTSLLKLQISKYTVWNYNSPGLWKHILKNRLHNVPTRVFVDVPGDNVRTVIKSLAVPISKGIATEWVFWLKSNDFDRLVQVFYDSPAHMALSAIVVDGKGVSSAVRCLKAPLKKRCFNNSSEFLQQYQRHMTKRKRFSSESLRLACAHIGSMRSCRTKVALAFMGFLSFKNVSFTVASYKSVDAMFSDLKAAKVDLIVGNTEVTEAFLMNQSFADVSSNYKTFYALHDGTYIVSLLDAIGSSPGVALAAFSLAFSVAVIAICRRLQFPRLSFTFPSHELLFLLASLFGTSYETHAKAGQKVRIRLLVYAVWMLGILPFSVYFRSELTSLVTAARPRDHLDTIAELERALDDDSVIPCVVKGSSAWESLETGSSKSGGFFAKLKAAYVRHKHQGIEGESVSKCFRCAMSTNRVCFIHQAPICWVTSQFKGLGEFKERFAMTLTAYPIAKESILSRPLRRLMSAMKEGGLARGPLPRCDSDAMPAKSTFKLWDFFTQFFVLTGMAPVVLAGEISVHIISKKRRP